MSRDITRSDGDADPMLGRSRSMMYRFTMSPVPLSGCKGCFPRAL